VRIASELVARGHDVTYVVPREFHAVLDGQGFRCAAPGFDIGPALLDEHAKYACRWGGARLMRRFFVRFLGPHLDELFQALDAEVASADAVGRAGGRALILASKERNAIELRSSPPGNRHAIWPFVPLEPLLPRSRGVIHAGGLGTTALTVSAGVPSAISPCFMDGIWHAQRHETLGIGVRIRRRNLHTAVERLVTDDDLHGRARELGQRIAHEDGTRLACDEIETFLKNHSREARP
jgi:UDP:flavonoid glycosyltransferase YjiC (YdhE family)